MNAAREHWYHIKYLLILQNVVKCICNKNKKPCCASCTFLYQQKVFFPTAAQQQIITVRFFQVLHLRSSSFSQTFALLAGTTTRYNRTAESLVLGCSADTSWAVGLLGGVLPGHQGPLHHHRLLALFQDQILLFLRKCLPSCRGRFLLLLLL